MAPKQANKYLYRNWVSYAGGVLAACGVLLVVFAVLFEMSLRKPSPYIGIFTYVLFPTIIGLGILVGLIGMRFEAKRRLRAGTTEALPYPSVDLNDPVHRRRFAILSGVGTMIAVIFAFTGYNGFLLTESVEFCGTTCHVAMEPEHTAYLSSAHARVRCVDCHVGEGAEYYVHSKLSGVRQLYGVLTNSYNRPIATPIKGLRPARETCQACHWPEKSWGSQLYQRPHFRYDEKNTPEQISMLIKTGGGGENGAGIHFHMFLGNEVSYVAEDEHLQEIPWTKVKRKDGSTVEYFRTEKKISPEGVAALPRHVMDCMDCHNRPAHNFEPPDLAVDKALAAGIISSTLPYAKSVAVDALSREYPTRDAAHAGLKREVSAFYADKYADVAAARAADVDKAIGGITAIYDRNVFPEMKVSWNTYPSNIGHRNWPGCFRCHDGKHVAADGRALVSECNACHTEPKRGPQSGMGEAMAATDQGWHPWEMPEKHLAIAKHAELQCSQCHLAGRRPRTECKDCHH